MPKYSVVVPLYNRPNELKELLDSLLIQSFSDFEVIIIEDGSEEKSDFLIPSYKSKLNIKYFFKENSGPGDSRNFGMQKAEGQYFIIFDSDCIIPQDYFKNVEDYLSHTPLDAFGGPDNAHPSFTNLQKAINYSMTSFITTGGIRGGKKQLDAYQPRSFNMGIKREVFYKVGGFSNLHPGEDPDWSYRIMDSGFHTGLIPEASVFHKRRINLKKFMQQVYKFGMARVILMKWHARSRKVVYLFPTSFFIFFIFSMLFGAVFSPLFFTPLLILALLVITEAFYKTKNIEIAFLALIASFTQLLAYGYGFLRAWTLVKLMGKDEKKALPEMFFQ